MKITELRVYPLKGARGVSVASARVQPRGLAGDRRWMLADDQGHFLQQRVLPQMAGLGARIVADGVLQVSADDHATLTVPVPSGSERLTVTVWGDQVHAADAGSEAAGWFSTVLGVPCRLVYMDAAARRPVDPKYGLVDADVSFADTMPLLLASEASLADLNRRLPEAITMDRFRPNVVVDGRQPWAEDRWGRLRIGDVSFQATHPCKRCIVTTIDQRTGTPAADREPLRTLATFRRTDGGVLFGMNLAPRQAGTIRVGDPLILEPDDSPRA